MICGGIVCLSTAKSHIFCKKFRKPLANCFVLWYDKSVQFRACINFVVQALIVSVRTAVQMQKSTP